jgi:hypothetical protein
LKKLAIIADKILNTVYDWHFDFRYSVSTRKFVDIANLETNSESILGARRYEGIPVRHFKNFLNSLDFDYKKFHFIDLGSGKGRAIMLASFYPFKSVTGVEIASNLHQVAIHNIENLQNSKKNICKKISSINSDVLDYIVPEGDKIFFLYNPFDSKILKIFLDKLENQIKPDQKIFFIYFNPLRGYLLELVGYNLVKVSNHSNHNRIAHLYQLSSKKTYAILASC